jgi:hypothetical protein
MGEDVCYMAMLDSEGRLSESPVIVWPVGSELPPPSGLRIMIGVGAPPADLWPLRLPELTGVDRTGLESPEHAGRVQMLVNAALHGRVVILHTPAECESATALAEVVRERLMALRN